MTIHQSHPFDPPAGERDQLRRLRGRLASGVTVWTAGTGTGPGQAAGLTVSSLMVAAGEPPRVLALLDPDSDLLEELRDTGTAVVQVLGWEHRQLAEMFAGTAPAPGGVFAQAAFEQTPWGPALVGTVGRLGVRLEAEREVGWSTEVTCVVEDVRVGEDQAALVHLRGRWRQVEGG